MEDTEDKHLNPLEIARKKLADLRVAKREARDRMFYETFDKIFVDPIKRKKREATVEDERLVEAIISDMVSYAESPEGSRELKNQIIYLDHPEKDPDYYSKIVRSQICGDIIGEMNGEYWNEYNTEEPLEAHPKCMGDTSLLIGFEDTEEGKEFKQLEEELVQEVQKLEKEW